MLTLQDFEGDEYKTHMTCMSEEQRYSIAIIVVYPILHLILAIQVREGFKNPRHGNFPWRGGYPPFPLGFREPTVRGGGEGGTPPFREEKIH